MLNLLQQLEQQGVIRALDYQFARLLHTMDSSPLVTLLAANVSHELGQGNVCMSLNGTLFALDNNASQPLVNHTGVAREQWPNLLSACPLVGDGSQPTPLVLDNHRLYLYRYWQYECNVARFLKRQQDEALDSQQARTILQRLFRRDYHFVAKQCAEQTAAQQQATIIKWLDIETSEPLDWPAIISAINQPTPDAGALDRLIPEAACLNWQKIAAALAASRSFSVISGGPGTGKTTTVTRLLALLTELGQDAPPTIKLVAPTGKAAARLTESIGSALARINCSDAVKEKIPTQAGTLHRLLGVIPGKSGFIHNQNNRLHLNILVVDEASMIDLPLMSQLLAALPDHARLILLGDRDQLSSVEAGSVLGDICRAASAGYSHQQVKLLETLTDHRLQPAAATQPAANHTVSDSLCLLRKSYRFDAQSGIGSLAKAVNGPDLDALASVFNGDFADIALLPMTDQSDYQRLIQHCVESYRPYLKLIQQQAEPEAILDAFNEFQLLCALRAGAFGITGLNEAIEKALQQQGLIDASSHWYQGRPVLITRNDHGLGLYNGDIGMTMQVDGRLKVVFQLPDKQLRLLLPSRLPEHETVYAMTIHKSQGSEFANVTMVLPDKDNPLITRELVYTGITRAKSTLSVFSGMDILTKAAKSPTQRESGLYQRLMSSE